MWQSNRWRGSLSHANFIDFRFDLSVAIFPLSVSYILKQNLALMVWLFACSQTDCCSVFFCFFCLWNRKIKHHQLQKTHTEHRRPRAVITFNPTVKESKQIKCRSTKQCKKPVHLATRNNLFLWSLRWNLLLQSVTSQSTFSPSGWLIGQLVIK